MGQNDNETPSGQPADADLRRGKQLELLDQCELPKGLKDSEGHGISPLALKAVLRAIDGFGRGRAGGAWAAVPTIATAANVGKRTATRAIEVLQSLGLLISEPHEDSRIGYRGSPTNKYTIVWSEVALHVYQNPLARGQFRRSFSPPDHSAPGAHHSAPGAHQSALGAHQSALGAQQSAPGTDQSAPGTDQSAPGTDQSAPGAHKSSLNRPRNVYEAPSIVDCDEDGAKREFLDHELAEIESKVRRIHKHAKARTVDDCELLIKIATLWNDGVLADDSVEQVLESYQAKQDAGDPVKNTMGWLWTAMANQCQSEGLHFERLLARCPFAESLVPAWAEPSEVRRLT